MKKSIILYENGPRAIVRRYCGGFDSIIYRDGSLKNCEKYLNCDKNVNILVKGDFNNLGLSEKQERTLVNTIIDICEKTGANKIFKAGRGKNYMRMLDLEGVVNGPNGVDIERFVRKEIERGV